MQPRTKRILLIVLWLLAGATFLGLWQDALDLTNPTIMAKWNRATIRESPPTPLPFLFVYGILYFTIPVIATLDHLGMLNLKRKVELVR